MAHLKAGSLKRIGAGVVLLAMLVVMMAAGPVAAASKDKIVIYHAGGIGNLHPYSDSLSPAYAIWEHMMEPLVEVDMEQRKYVPKLAESWEFKGKEWVFKLRKGIKFHDGSPFTAKDVIFSFNRMKTDKKSLQRRQLRDIVEMTAPDDYTVVLKTKKPSIVLLDALQSRFIMSKASADKYGKDVDKHPNGTGPYKFESFKRDGELVLVRNDEYWGPRKPQVKTMIWRKVTEEAARVAALEAGQADVINAVPAHDVARLKKNPKVDIKAVPGLRVYFLAMNPAFKPWDNKLVRQAANYAVDPTPIIKHIFDGAGFVLQGAGAPHNIGYDPNSKRYPYDPKKARELLAKAGYPNGVDVKLFYSAGRYPKDTESLQAIVGQMKKAGFNVELVSQEWAVFWGKGGVNGGKQPFYYVGRGSVLDVNTHLNQYFRSGASKRVSGYKNPELDRVIDAEQQEPDPQKREKLLHQAGRIVMEDAPWIPLWNLADIYGTARNIEWKPRPDERVRTNEMTIIE